MLPFDVFTAPLHGMQLVEASAGTGKTWTLSTLVLRLVLEKGWRISQILVVTFTNAAAAELRGRVRQRLSDALNALRLRADCTAAHDAPAPDPSLPRLLNNALVHTGLTPIELQHRLMSALAEFDEAAVLTIHAFCQRALRESAFAARLPLEHDVQQNDRDQRLSAVADHWRTHIAPRPWPNALVADLARHRDRPASWSDLLKAFDDVPMATPRWPGSIEPNAAEPPATLEALTATLGDIYRAACGVWQADHATIVALVNDAAVAKQLHQGSYKPHLIARAAASWQNFCQANDPLAVIDWTAQAKLFTVDFMSRGKAPPPQHLFFELARQVKEAHQAVTTEAGSHRLALLRRMLSDSSEALRVAKASQRVMTYHDMLAKLQQRLRTDATLADTLRQTFPAALIDEFQDTDALQLAIFHNLYQGTNAPVFMVGDPKQAIYAFRGADVQSYLQARTDAGSTATLRQNQRSTPELIGALNALFTRQDNPLGEHALQYHPVTPGTRQRSVLTDRRDPTGDTRAALDVWALPTMRGDHKLSRRDAQHLAVDACATDIAQTLSAAREGKVLLDAEPLRGGHIAVIVETHRQGRQMREALTTLGVPSVELSRATVFTSTEAQELLRVLQGIHHVGDPGMLRAALSTELLDIDALTLATTFDGDGSDQAAPHDARFDNAIMRMAAWRALWAAHGIAAMLWRLFDDVGLALRMLGRPDGHRRMTNAMHLLELLNQAAQTRPSPNATLDWFDAQLTEARDSDEAMLRLDTDQHLVQIVTVHHAKGLEYPIVYAPLLWSAANRASRKLGVTYHDDDGEHVIDFRGEDDDNVGGHIKARVLHEKNTELLRKIYVSLTRAVHRCILVVDFHTRGSLERNDYASLKSMLNWIVGGGGHTLATWHDLGKHPGNRAVELANEWSSLAADSQPLIALNPVDPVALGDRPLAPETPPEIVDHPSPGPIGPAWRMGSFSAWVQHHTRNEAAALGTTSAPVSPVFSPDATDILHFPRGPSAGDAFHAVLERVDFTSPSIWPSVVHAALQLHPQPQTPLADHGTMLLRMMGDLVDTELAPGVRLADVMSDRRLHELEFDMALQHADVRGLAHALADLGMPMPALSPTVMGAPFNGHLRGFIDLVFEHRGRYFVIDWKSNHLGDVPEAYHDTGMHHAMLEHGYHLQLALYALALRRHLRHVLGNAGAQQAWGGAFALFIRGVRPDWRQADGRPAGVLAQPLRFDQLEALDALLLSRPLATQP